jgi:hypothetical protein
LKRILRITSLVFAVIALAPNNVCAADGRPESQESNCSRPAEKETVEGCSSIREEHAAQDSSRTEKKENSGLLRSWLRMADKAKANQPDWLSPLATTSGRLKQELRYDVFDQPSSSGSRIYQLGGNKGFEFIASSRTQILAGVPTYTVQSPNGPAGGFGDIPQQLKFRIASAEQREGNYLLTFVLGATAPTGSHRYGSGDAVLTPTLAAGKGWGRFDVQSTFGANLPTGNTSKLGRQLQWNTAFQYEAAWKLWPELEVNSTFFRTGKNRGETQTFLTPGAGFGRVRVGRRFRFSTAAGMQIAASRFHTFNHRWIFSERLSF